MNGDGDDPRVVTAEFAVVYVNIITPAHVVVTETQIRQSASRGHIRRVGTYWTGRSQKNQGRNPTTYDLDEIIAYVRSRGLAG